MDAFISQLFSPGSLVLACAVFILTFFVRRIAETAVPSLVKKADANDPGVSYETQLARWWNEVILYAVPVILGALAGLIAMPFIFGEEIQTVAARCLYGGVVGWFSSFFYKVVKKLMPKKAGVEDPGEEVP